MKKLKKIVKNSIKKAITEFLDTSEAALSQKTAQKSLLSLISNIIKQIHVFVVQGNLGNCTFWMLPWVLRLKGAWVGAS